jgi:hypothetical protein
MTLERLDPCALPTRILAVLQRQGARRGVLALTHCPVTLADLTDEQHDRHSIGHDVVKSDENLKSISPDPQQLDADRQIRLEVERLLGEPGSCLPSLGRPELGRQVREIVHRQAPRSRRPHHLHRFPIKRHEGGAESVVPRYDQGKGLLQRADIKRAR